MTKRLVIDLNKCDRCEKCEVECSYFYRAKASEHGALMLRELATFATVCRRCEEASCVASCRFDALERQPDGIIRRHNMRCVSCKSCSLGCPFGTIYPECLPFYVVNCDCCATVGGESAPKCAMSCEQKAIEFREVDFAVEKDAFPVGDHLAVKGPRWDKKDV